jgi:hypothetical protein
MCPVKHGRTSGGKNNLRVNAALGEGAMVAIAAIAEDKIASRLSLITKDFEGGVAMVAIYALTPRRDGDDPESMF